MKGKSPVKIIGNLIMLVTVVLLIGLSFPQLYGMEGYAVASGSMIPALGVGSAVYVKAKAPELVEQGEIITFTTDTGGVRITHRVVKNDKERQSFITKGDANESEDIQPVKWKNLCGTVVFSVPYAGYILKFLGSGNGKGAMLFFLLAISLCTEMSGGEIIKKDRETD